MSIESLTYPSEKSTIVVRGNGLNGKTPEEADRSTLISKLWSNPLCNVIELSTLKLIIRCWKENLFNRLRCFRYRCVRTICRITIALSIRHLCWLVTKMFLRDPKEADASDDLVLIPAPAFEDRLWRVIKLGPLKSVVKLMKHRAFSVLSSKPSREISEEE
jgi:hypothetical protein